MGAKKGIPSWNKGIYNNKQTFNDHQKEILCNKNTSNHKNAYTDRVKMSVFSHYSPELLCNCCHESEYEFLTIDHMKDRSIYGHGNNIKSGWNLINWIYQNDFPDGFRILCFNCNSGRSKFVVDGICPHENMNDWEWEL